MVASAWIGDDLVPEHFQEQKNILTPVLSAHADIKLEGNYKEN